MTCRRRRAARGDPGHATPPNLDLRGLSSPRYIMINRKAQHILLRTFPIHAGENLWTHTLCILSQVGPAFSFVDDTPGTDGFFRRKSPVWLGQGIDFNGFPPLVEQVLHPNHASLKMVWKTIFLLDTAILGFHLKFRGWICDGDGERLTFQFKKPMAHPCGDATGPLGTGSAWQGGVECETSSPHQLRIARGHWSFCFLQWPSGPGRGGRGQTCWGKPVKMHRLFQERSILFCECFPIWVLGFCFFWFLWLFVFAPS